MSFKKFLAVLTALVVSAMASLVIQPVSAVGTSTFYVARSGSVGNGTSCASPSFVGTTHAPIQAALNAASTGDTVYVCAGTYAISTRLEITKTLTLTGVGAPSVFLDGGGTTQILIIQDASLNDGVSGDEITATVENVTFQNGYATAINSSECVDGNRCGGAIFVEDESRINVSNSHFYNNKADFIGGAIARFIGNYQTVPSTINNSSFEANKAGLDGGAIATLFGYGLTINRSTFYQNGLLATHMARSGAAIIANFANATVNDSTLVDHDAPAGITVLYGDITVNRSLLAQTAGSTTDICNGSQTASGARSNLVTDNSCGISQLKSAVGVGDSAKVAYGDLNLGTFGFRGYATKSIPLLSGSAALDHWTGCSGTDQVGESVPQGASCDVGASEQSATAPTTTTTTTTSTTTTSSTTTTVPGSSTTAAPATTVATTVAAVEVAPTTTVSFGQTQIARVVTSTTIAERQAQATAASTTTTVPRPVATTVAPSTTVPEIAEAAPGEASLLVGGEEVEATLSRSNDQLVIAAGEMSATISGVTSDGAIAPLDSEGNIRLSDGDQIQVEASGFAPNSDVEVWLFSTPTLLGTVAVNGEGTASSKFALPRGVESGNHRVALNGKNAVGDDASFAVGIVIGSSSGGVSTAGKVLISVPIALAVLFALVIPARRRRKVELA